MTSRLLSLSPSSWLFLLLLLLNLSLSWPTTPGVGPGRCLRTVEWSDLQSPPRFGPPVTGVPSAAGRRDVYQGSLNATHLVGGNSNFSKSMVTFRGFLHVFLRCLGCFPTLLSRLFVFTMFKKGFYHGKTPWKSMKSPCRIIYFKLCPTTLKGKSHAGSRILNLQLL